MVSPMQWRDGRVVDYSSLENYRTERYRGFESLSLRNLKRKKFVLNFFLFLFSSMFSSLIDKNTHKTLA